MRFHIRRRFTDAHPWVHSTVNGLRGQEPTREEIIGRCVSAAEDASRDGVSRQLVLDVNAFRALAWLYPELAT